MNFSYFVYFFYQNFERKILTYADIPFLYCSSPGFALCESSERIDDLIFVETKLISLFMEKFDCVFNLFFKSSEFIKTQFIST